MPNYLVLRRDGYIAAKNHVSLLDRVKYVSKEMDQNIMASLFNIDKLYISNAQYNSAVEGATEVIANIWPNTGFLGYKPASVGPKKLSSGYTFMKDGGMKVRRWRDEEREAEAIEVDAKYALKVAASLTGYLISDIT